MSFRQMLPFLFLNVVVSTVVVLSILFWWDNRNNPEATPEAAAEIAAGGEMPTPNIAAPPSGTVPAEAQPAAGGDEPVIHTVQAGETLGRISEQYDVSIDDILTVNGLTDPNVIGAGQQLIIPVGGIPTPTTAPPTPTEAPVLPTPISTEPVATGQGQIAVTGVIDAGALASEAVQIVNNGAEAQLMEGWTVRDEDGNVYTFGRVSIFGEGAGVLLNTRAGDDSATDLFWGLTEPAWRSGETLTLMDNASGVVATFAIP
jgi:LysM repeat protein